MAAARTILDALKGRSPAYRELLRQERSAPPPPPDSEAIAMLTGDDRGPAAYDLEAIWRVNLADESCPDAIGRRRYMSPRRFANRWSLLVSSRDDVGNRILVDRDAAFIYCQQIDSRVMGAAVELVMSREDGRIAEDPLGHAVDACLGGPFALMMIRDRAAEAAGMRPEDLASAVLGRAKEDASRLDDFAAETLLSVVRRAMEGASMIEVPGESDPGDHSG
jgi:hypothetical protein